LAVRNLQGFYVLLSYSPKWFNDELGFDLQSAGFLAALPYIVKYLLSQAGGFCVRARDCCPISRETILTRVRVCMHRRHSRET